MFNTNDNNNHNDNNNCRNYILQLESQPPSEGELSLSRGFIPARQTPAKLPASHQQWDELARSLPELFLSNKTQQILDALPILDAEARTLPESALARAGVVLSALAHAYWRFGGQRFFASRITQVPTFLPSGILEPWKVVSRRLGRVEPHRPYQSFQDLFLGNYYLRDSTGCPLVENIEVLVPTFGNEAERIFYAIFVEMHFHFSPIVEAICNLEACLANDDSVGVCLHLATMSKAAARATASWQKIGACPDAPSYCDPIVWSKSVAILGVPPALCPQGGTSGACAPVIYVLDALLGRGRYGSYYGQYVKTTAGAMTPASIKELAHRSSALGLRSYVEARRGSRQGQQLEEAFTHLTQQYAGKAGWLGRHVSKAFSYLCISTLSGRNASVSGHERYFSKRTWENAADNLNLSRHERICPFSHQQSGANLSSGRLVTSDSRTYEKPLQDSELVPISRLEVARHHDADDLWIIVDDIVYDVSTYVSRHPGGAHLLMAYAGQDATEPFRSQNVHQTWSVSRRLQKLAIGRASFPLLSAKDDRLGDWLYGLLRTRQALVLQLGHDFGGSFPLQLFSCEHVHSQLWDDFLPDALKKLSEDLSRSFLDSKVRRVMLSQAQSLSDSFDYRGPIAPDLESIIRKRCQLIVSMDLPLVEALLESAIDAIEALNTQREGDSVLANLVDEIETRLTQCIKITNQKQDRLQSRLQHSELTGPSTALYGGRRRAIGG